MYHSIYSGLINKKWKNDGRYGIIIRYAYIHRKGSGVEDRVSVILLIYMVEAYLPKCIESAINQTYKDIEIILSVSEGPDRCVEICREYAAKDDRIKVVQRERKGRGPGRNFGMEAATGKYVFFIDGDDCMGETMVEKLVLAAKKHGADAVICGDQYEYENEPGRVEKHIAGLPEALVESAKIDGAGDLRVYWQIIFPLCMPVLATVALFVAVGAWNSWFDTYLYCGSEKDLYTLQYILKMKLATTQNSANAAQTSVDALKTTTLTTPVTIRCAITVISTVPILIVYPFLQKYFVTGMALGAVKG